MADASSGNRVLRAWPGSSSCLMRTGRREMRRPGAYKTVFEKPFKLKAAVLSMPAHRGDFSCSRAYLFLSVMSLNSNIEPLRNVKLDSQIRHHNSASMAQASYVWLNLKPIFVSPPILWRMNGRHREAMRQARKYHYEARIIKARYKIFINLNACEYR